MVAGAHFLPGMISSYLAQARARPRAPWNLGLSTSAQDLSIASARLYTCRARSNLATTLLLLGYPAAALKIDREFLHAMRRRSDPASLAAALFREALLHVPVQESGAVLERAEELLPIATEHDLRVYRDRWLRSRLGAGT
jgi:hypothetical protein